MSVQFTVLTSFRVCAIGHFGTDEHQGQEGTRELQGAKPCGLARALQFYIELGALHARL